MPTISRLATIGLSLMCAQALPRAASAQADAKTVRLWKAKCASCHGVDGRGKTETGAKLAIPDMAAADWQK